MKKINKTVARNIFNRGIGAVTFLPCNVPLSTPWGLAYTCSRDNVGHDVDFDKVVNSFEIYNCVYELGRYAAYYVDDEVYNTYKGV
jgi:hypothetical protein